MWNVIWCVNDLAFLATPVGLQTHTGIQTTHTHPDIIHLNPHAKSMTPLYFFKKSTSYLKGLHFNKATMRLFVDIFILVMFIDFLFLFVFVIFIDVVFLMVFKQLLLLPVGLYWCLMIPYGFQWCPFDFYWFQLLAYWFSKSQAKSVRARSMASLTSEAAGPRLLCRRMEFAHIWLGSLSLWACTFGRFCLTGCAWSISLSVWAWHACAS